jgi:tRNA threonylcarbamoyladenosine biosynthesis protein TsaE
VRIERSTGSVQETAALGRAIGGVLRPGDIVGLDGPLGAGKTELVRWIGAALGVDRSLVSSPTFVMVNEYPLGDGGELVHVDAYRLGSTEELDTLGWDRLTDGSAIIVIEWAERIAEALPASCGRIRIDPVGETEREFVMDLPEAWASREGFGALREPTTCPVTGEPVSADNPHYPFASERAKLADLYRWFSGSYSAGREMTEDDFED